MILYKVVESLPFIFIKEVASSISKYLRANEIQVRNLSFDEIHNFTTTPTKLSKETH
jgi:hypothetical protein